METLPTELVTDIFQINGNELFAPSNYQTVLQYLCAITHVSSRWREIALSTPLLWRKVVFSTSHGSFAKSLNWMMLCLKRSGDVSVDLYLHMHSILHNSNCIQSLYDAIAPHLHRCNKLEMHGVGDRFSELMLPLRSNKGLIQLRSLTVHDNTPARSGNRFFGDWAMAPSVEEVVGFQVDASSLETMATGSLKRLRLGSFRDWKSVLTLLSRSPSLMQLQLISLGVETQYPTQPILLPNLQNLAVYNMQFGRLVSAPRLERLTCLCFDHQDELAFPNSLKNLALFRATKRCLEGWRPAPSLDRLATLHLISCERPDFVLDLLLVVDEANAGSVISPRFFPELRVLRLIGCDTLYPKSRQYGEHIAQVLEFRPSLRVECSQPFKSSLFQTPQMAKKFGNRFDGVYKDNWTVEFSDLS